MKYDPTKEEDDAKALFRQQVPKSFLTLQNKCLAYVEHCQDLVEPTTEGAWQEGEGPGCHDGLMPVMNEEEFRYMYNTCTCTCACVHVCGKYVCVYPLV